MLVQKQILQNNYKTPSRAYGSGSFRGEVPYFKQGAIVSPENRTEFMEKYAFTTEKQILQTKLRPLPTDEEINALMKGCNNKNTFLRNLMRQLFSLEDSFTIYTNAYIQNPNKEHWAYHPVREESTENVKEIFKKAHQLFNSTSNENVKNQARNLIDKEKFIMNDYKKRGLKDFICSQIFSATGNDKKINVLYMLKTKHFDSDLSEDVRKVVQRAYDDFGVIIFPVNDKKIAIQLYEALQVAHIAI